jgi:tetratricopeptide (TPR) repeat protein
MKKTYTVYATITAASLFVLSAVSCSSAPKRAMRITDTAEKAAERYELANTELLSGKVMSAGSHLEQAYELALSVDDTSLLCRIMLSRISQQLAIKNGMKEQTTTAAESAAVTETSTPVSSASTGISAATTAGIAAPASGTAPLLLVHLGTDVDSLIESAREQARRSASKDTLEAVCNIYAARIAISGIKETDTAQLSSVQNMLDGQEKNLGKEPYYLAYLYRTKGDAFALAKDYKKADEQYVKAADIHTKNRYLAEIGVDWYRAAQVRSKNGDKTGALSAIETALKYDRDSENTMAIASDYYAYAIILMKGTPDEKEKVQAQKAALWSSSVYRSGGYADMAVSAAAYADLISTKK